MPTFLSELVERHQGAEDNGLLNEVLAMGDTAVEPLIASLREETGIGRVMAAQFLGHIGNLQAVEALISVLEEDRSYWSDRRTKRRGRIDGFLDFLDRERHRQLHAAEVAIVRRNCAFALGKLGDSRAIDLLRKLLEDSDEPVRAAARDALVRLAAD